MYPPLKGSCRQSVTLSSPAVVFHPDKACYTGRERRIAGPGVPVEARLNAGGWIMSSEANSNNHENRENDFLDMVIGTTIFTAFFMGIALVGGVLAFFLK
jgi:hypothetical protein